MESGISVVFTLCLRLSVSAVLIRIWPIINTCCCLCSVDVFPESPDEAPKTTYHCLYMVIRENYLHWSNKVPIKSPFQFSELLEELFVLLLKLHFSSKRLFVWRVGKFLACLFLFSEEEAKLGARRLARCLQKIGFKVSKWINSYLKIL